MANKKKILIPLFFVGFILFYHAFGYVGHFGYDDLYYAQLANDLKNGIIDYSDHYSFRTTILFLTALSYSLFGISDFSSSLPAIFISIAILYFVFQILKEKNLRTLILGLSLTTFSQWFLFYSDKLMPDIYVAFSVICALFIIHHYRYKNKNNKTIVYSVLLGLALLFGFMSKGTIILILPLLLYYFAVDLLEKRNIRFWLATFGVGLALLSIYFLTTKLITGEAFRRFGAIADNSYLNRCSYDQESIRILFKRIGYDFFRLLVYQELAVGFIFVLAYPFKKRSLRFLKMEDSLAFWVTSSLILLLSSNFMTISLTSYSPMCLDPRHYIFLIPVTAIPASIIINDFIETKQYKTAILAGSAIAAAVSFLSPGESFWHLYLPLFVILLLYSILRANRSYKDFFTALLIGIFCITPVTMMNYARKIQYKKQRDVFSKMILQSDDSLTVITNEVQKRLGNYYNHFDDSGLISFVNYDEFQYDSTDHRRKLLFFNWYTRYLTNLSKSELPYYARHASEDNKLLYQDKELKIEVYEMSRFLFPQEAGQLLIQSFNGFEEDTTPYWHQNKADISHEVHYGGRSSILVKEYSATFAYPVDSLLNQEISQLVISTSVYCYFPDETHSKLVISVEDRKGAYIWRAIEVNKHLKSYSGWWPIRYEISINKGDLKEKSTLKVYLWNKDKQEAYIDNFRVKVTGL